jgi:hypothetical protein
MGALTVPQRHNGVSKQLWRLELLYAAQMASTGRSFGCTNLTTLGTHESVENYLGSLRAHGTFDALRSRDV